MKESEIKARIATFLKRTARTVVLPAAMGLGLGLGCGGDRAVEVPNDGGAQAEAGVVTKYGTPFPQPDYAAPFPEPPPNYADYAAPFPEPPPNYAEYAAPFPEPSDGGVEDDATIEVRPMYAAPFPEPDASA